MNKDTETLIAEALTDRFREYQPLIDDAIEIVYQRVHLKGYFGWADRTHLLGVFFRADVLLGRRSN